MKRQAQGASNAFVLAVVACLAVGIMVPLVAQSVQQGALTQCRENLRQIGQAIALYAADYSNFAPAIGGNFYLQGDRPYHSDGKWTLPWKDPWSDPANPPGHFGSFSAVAPSSTQMVIGQPQPWLCTEKAPSRAIGLGLLWTGGYLGNKNPSVLYCPGSVASEELTKAGVPRNHMFDADEPFWTSGGKVIRGDNDGLGNPGKPNAVTGSEWYECTTDGKLSGRLVQGLCSVWSNYSWRVDEDRIELNKKGAAGMRAHPMATKIGGAVRKGLFADNIDHWTAAQGPFTMKQLINPPKYEYPPAPDRYDMARERFISNHDAAYNVLFDDGSVKTFQDVADELYMALVDWRGASSTRPGWATTLFVPTSPRPKTSGSEIWKPFLDMAAAGAE